MFLHSKSILSSILSSALLLISLTATSTENKDSLEVLFIRVVDGDTIQTIFTLPSPLHKIKIRIRDIDTPESTYRAKCPSEKTRGKKATEYLKYLLKGARTIILTNYKWDKYGGRVTATVYYKNINIGQKMINSGHAMSYDGGKKASWCE